MRSSDHTATSIQQTTLMPREKLLAVGAENLSDAELLAIFLRTGIKGTPVVQLAEQLIAQVGLRGLFRLQQQQVKELKGLGMAKYIQLQAVLELSRRFLLADLPQDEPIDKPEAIQGYLIAKLGLSKDEQFAAVFLDAKHCIIKFEVLFIGTVNEATVYPRTLIKKAIEYNAVAVILAHNHPSNKLLASEQDKQLTRKLKDILQVINVRLLDHFIVGCTECASMARQGLL